MLQTRESGKENTATHCLKGSPVCALPCLCKGGILVCGEDGQGSTREKVKAQQWWALRSPEEFKNIERVHTHCSGGTCERAESETFSERSNGYPCHFCFSVLISMGLNRSIFLLVMLGFFIGKESSQLKVECHFLTAFSLVSFWEWYGLRRCTEI